MTLCRVLEVVWSKAGIIINWIANNSLAGSEVSTHSSHSSLFTAAAAGRRLNSSPHVGGVELDSSGFDFFFFKAEKKKLLTLDLECVGVLGHVQCRVPGAV